ncbi:MAG: PD40 domain-containing protein [Rhodothermales bacterium]|nr:PD40 domain-containing protein [Rhodothermales bacterium]MBO6778985.1 PD40 domain-containing protein [Rhodothermales bacterium]
MLRRLSILLSLAAVALCAAAPAAAQYFRYGKNKVHYDSQPWYYLRTEHFDVYYYEGGKELADFAAHAAEEAYLKVADLFAYEPTGPIPMLVYTSHNAFAVTNAVELPTFSDGIGGVTELFKNRIAVPFTGDYADFRHVIHHELVHAVINDIYYGGSIQSIIANNIQTRIPLWFNEGLAEYSAADGWDSESDMYLREAILEDHLPEINRLGGFFAYRGGQGVWDYIGEQYGREKIAEILNRLRLSRSVDGSFRRAIGLDVEQLSERWQRSLREIHFPEVAAREDLSEIGRAIVTREEGFYNTSPALSPQGDRVAYISTRSGLFDVYIASVADGRVEKRLIQGQTSTGFESLRLLTPSLAWSPDGSTLALAVKQGEADAVALVDVETGSSRHIRVGDTEQIFSVAWHPEGRRLAVSAADGPQSDIYVVDAQGHRAVNLTNDAFSDHEPVWSPDGRFLVFQSDRGERLLLGQETVRMLDHNFEQKSLYRLVPGRGYVDRLTNSGRWEDGRPQFGPDANRLLFISDRNGVPNLHLKDLESGLERAVTDLTIGAMGMSVAANGQRAAVVSLKDGTPSIFVLRTPFERTPPDALRPNVWAQRMDPTSTVDAPALALAGSAQRRSNPFLRSAAHAPQPQVAPEFEIAGLGGDDDPIRLAPDSPVVDSILADIQVDFRNYTFSPAFSEAARDLVGRPSLLSSDYLPRAVVDDDGEYAPRKYKLDFSPDIVHGAAGYDALYGVQGLTQMIFSDMLGNHRITVATNLLIDLRNSDYLLSYEYLPRRVDWTTSGFHVSRLLANFADNRPTYYRYRQYGASLSASYPLSKFRRVDAEISLIGVNQTDITDALQPSATRSLIVPRLTFTRDVTTPGYLHPVDGSRMAMSLSGSPFGLGGQPTRFITALGDIRTYHSFLGGAYTFAVRGSAAASLGPERQLFYTSGVLNWINRTFDDLNGLPIDDASDFILATPIVPLRGFDINARNGSYFGLVNAEFRFPLVAAMLPGPMPFLPLYNIQGQVFADAGMIWGGRNDGDGLSLRTHHPDGYMVFDDLLTSAGFGVRTIFLGYPLRFDFAWPFDGRGFGDRRTYISLGLDF